MSNQQPKLWKGVHLVLLMIIVFLTSLKQQLKLLIVAMNIALAGVNRLVTDTTKLYIVSKDSYSMFRSASFSSKLILTL